MSSKKPSVNSKGKRHKARILAFQALFSWDFTRNSVEDLLDFSWQKSEQDDEVLLFARLLISGTMENLVDVDKTIEAKLSNWTMDRLNRADLAILRTGVYSLMFQKDIPPQVTINEAVEIAKEYANPESFKFINAVMDGVHKSMI